MTQTDLIHELFAIIDDGTNWAKLTELFAPDAVYFRPGYKPMRGLAEIQEFYAETRQILMGAHHIYRVLSDGPTSCCWGMFSGTTKVHGKIALYFTDWYRFSGELITYRRTFFYQPMI